MAQIKIYLLHLPVNFTEQIYSPSIAFSVKPGRLSFDVVFLQWTAKKLIKLYSADEFSFEVLLVEIHAVWINCKINCLTPALTSRVKHWVIKSFLTFDPIDKTLMCDYSLESC